MIKSADLHVHTNFSDSTASPQEVVQEACQRNLACISITDHDTTDGVLPTQLAAKSTALEVIAGIELSSQMQGQEIHILGYFIDISDDVLQNKLQEVQQSRRKRLGLMIEKLKTLGIHNINTEEICQRFPSASIGRPHLATVLYEKGWVTSIPQAFERYLRDNGPAYVCRDDLSPVAAIELIKLAGGVAVFAHPMLTRKDELIPALAEAGLGGIEVNYPNCSEVITNYYSAFADKYHLIKTGGSDAHGKTKNNTFIGKQTVSCEIVEQLRAAAGKIK